MWKSVCCSSSVETFLEFYSRSCLEYVQVRWNKVHEKLTATAAPVAFAFPAFAAFAFLPTVAVPEACKFNQRPLSTKLRVARCNFNLLTAAAPATAVPFFFFLASSTGMDRSLRLPRLMPRLESSASSSPTISEPELAVAVDEPFFAAAEP